VEYLKKNFEKVILSVLLILFVLALVWLISIFDTVGAEDVIVTTRPPESRMDFSKKETGEKFNLTKKINKTAEVSVIKGARVTRTGLLSPVPMAICPNPVGTPIEVTDPKTGEVTVEQRHCDRLIDRSLFKNGSRCPYCGGTMHEPAIGDITGSVDSDGDGIPDDVERKFGLDPAKADDAHGDMDGDGFSNVVEYLGEADGFELDKQSDMSDPLDHPSLAYRLYFAGAKSKVLNLWIDKIDSYGDNKKLWSVYFMVKVKNKKKPYIKGINDKLEIKGVTYTVVKIEKKTETYDDETTNRTGLKRDVSVVYITSSKYPGKTIKALAKQKVLEPGRLVSLVDSTTESKFMVNLEDSNREIAVGDQSVGIEKFIVKSIDDEKNVVKVETLDGKSKFDVFDEENAPNIHGTSESAGAGSDTFEPSF